LLLLSLYAGPALAQTAISEVRIDQPSTDNDEYFELIDAPGASLDGLTYLVIGDGTGGSGVIEAVIDLSGQVVPPGGYFVAAEGTFSLGSADLTANLNFENSDNVTHLLVSDFTGSNGDDLDTNDDGVLDLTPWGGVLSCVALVESFGSGELTYCADSVGPDGTFVPAHAYRCESGWNIGAFDPAGGSDTPGAANPCGPVLENTLINEIRIDQPGTDTDEYVELLSDGAVIGPTHYLVIGDGSAGSGVIEAAIDLSGLTPSAEGLLVIAEATFALGPADLVTDLNFENSDNVTHLLVRDFTGAVGDDLDADDDGVPDAMPWSEVQDCVALVETPGSGDRIYCETTVGPDGTFVPAHAYRCNGSWNIGAFDPAGGDDTPGAENLCGGPAGALVINEIDYDQPGTDRGEFIEIFNGGAEAADLGGHSIVLVNGSGGGAAVYNTIDLPAVSLPVGEYFVVCGDAPETFNCDLDVSPDSNLVQNGAPDAVALFRNGSLIDTVSYEGDTAAPYTEGSGAGLTDSSSTPFTGISRFPDGSDSDVNNVDFSLRCITPGAANADAASDCADPRPPALKINEIDYDQPGTDTAEFIEILNAGASAADLSGIDLVLVNGNTGSPYLSIALPSAVLEGGEYFVVCADAATVANCDLDVSPDSNLIQNGAPDAVALQRGDQVIDTVSYEGDTAAPYTEGSGSGLMDHSSLEHFGISRLPDGTDTDLNNADLSGACITPGFPNTALTDNCTPNGPRLEIFQIQGSGAESPFQGQGVLTEGNIVTAVGPEGFFMQTPDDRDDTDVDTSNGIYVFTGVAPGVAEGDRVDVFGTVQEFFGFTEFGSGATVTVNSSGHPLPAVTVFDAQVPSPDPAAPSCLLEYECYEGMLITIQGGTVTGPNQSFGSDPLAEVHITAAPGRAFREPGIEYPGLAGYPEWDGNPEVFELDPDKLGLPNQAIPAGSTFDATGALGFEFGGYELWPNSLTVQAAPLPAAVRASTPDEMTVGALNLFRLFDDIDDPAIEVRDPDTDELLRLTDDAVVDSDEYQARLAKLSAYIRTVLNAPDVLAVSEVESLKVLQNLGDAIGADDAALHYTAYLEEGNDVGGIDVGFLVQATVAVDSITQLGRFERLSMDNSLLNDRPPLLLEGRQMAEGSDFPFAVIALHGRSLGGIDDPADGPRVRQKRYEQAQSVAAKVQALQDVDPGLNLVVTGDFNAYEFTDGYADVTGFMQGSFTPQDNLVCEDNPCDDRVSPDLLSQVKMIPPGERYSFIFRGSSQVLDHALTSESLDALVRDFAYGRGNADAAVVLVEDPATPLRSSDHDGLVLYLAKDSDGDGVTDDLDVCPGTAIPEGAPTRELGVNHWALVDGDGVFDTTAPEGLGPDAAFDVFDTAGCSCEQIVAARHLGVGHLKHGCSLGVMEVWIQAIGSR
jgi:predicted extracellular nuclease